MRTIKITKTRQYIVEVVQCEQCPVNTGAESPYDLPNGWVKVHQVGGDQWVYLCPKCGDEALSQMQGAKK